MRLRSRVNRSLFLLLLLPLAGMILVQLALFGGMRERISEQGRALARVEAADRELAAEQAAALERESRERAEVAAQQIALLVRERIARAEEAAETIAGFPGVRELLLGRGAGPSPLLLDQQVMRHQLYICAIHRRDGSIACAVPGVHSEPGQDPVADLETIPPGGPAQDNDWLDRLHADLRDRRSLLPVRQGPRQEWLLVISHPVSDPANLLPRTFSACLGAVRIAVPLHDLFTDHPMPDGIALQLVAAGIALSIPTAEEAGRVLPNAHARQTVASGLEVVASAESHRPDAQMRQELLAGLARTIAGIRAEEDRLRTMVLILWGSLAANVLLMFALAWVFAMHLQRRVIDPLEEIAGKAAAVGDGQLDRAVELVNAGDAEIARVVSSIESMRLRLNTEIASLQSANRQANAAVEAKSRFLATMSHEIRTPMNGVLGMVQLMDAGELAPAQRERLGIIRASAEALLVVINDILDFSKLEAGMMQLDASQVALAPLTRDLAALLGPQAQRKGLALRLAVPPALACRGDAARVRQVLMNLLGNAIKFTETGSVTVRAAESGGTVRIEVADTGPGIAPGDLARLFRDFSQLDDGQARRHGGTGLGLAISKRLVELMGGTIGVDSRPGKGSVFWCELPRASTEFIKRIPDEDASGLRVAVCLADPIAARIYAMALKAQGHRAEPVADLAAAVAAAAGADALIIATAQLGDEPAAAITALRRARADLPVIAVLGSSDAGDDASRAAELRLLDPGPPDADALRKALE